MSSGSISPRAGLTLGLLALAPVAWYGVASNQTAGVVSAINVVLIIVTVAVAMRPLKSRHGDASV